MGCVYHRRLEIAYLKPSLCSIAEALGSVLSTHSQPSVTLISRDLMPSSGLSINACGTLNIGKTLTHKILFKNRVEPSDRKGPAYRKIPNMSKWTHHFFRDSTLRYKHLRLSTLCAPRLCNRNTNYSSNKAALGMLINTTLLTSPRDDCLSDIKVTLGIYRQPRPT